MMTIKNYSCKNSEDLPDGAKNISVKGSNFQETAVANEFVEIKSIRGH